VRDKLEIVETLKLGQVIGVNTDWGSWMNGSGFKKETFLLYVYSNNMKLIHKVWSSICADVVVHFSPLC
jgi:hypothetical protein